VLYTFLDILACPGWKRRTRSNWHATHPKPFEQAKQQVVETVDESLTDHAVGTTW
jgi:hypothetical protein